jgi:phosphoglycolate phosphatase
MILFFDLDGPLIDVSPRYVRLHLDLLARFGVGGLDTGCYWQRKRAACPEEIILKDLGADTYAAEYLRLRLDLIETPEYIVHDRLWPWTHAVLARLSASHSLVLVTARSRRQLLQEQLAHLRLDAYFHEVLSTPAGRHVDQQKAALIRDYLDRHGLPRRGHWMIGDTEADIGAGRHLGLHVAAVLSGIRNRELLLRTQPDYLLDDIRELTLIVDSRAPLPVPSGELRCP